MKTIKIIVFSLLITPFFITCFEDDTLTSTPIILTAEEETEDILSLSGTIQNTALSNSKDWTTASAELASTCEDLSNL